MKKLITFIIFLFLIFLFFGCGSSYHLKRARYHMMKAEFLGAKVNTDTLFKDVKFTVPAVKVEFTPKPLHTSDTMIFEKDKVITKVLIHHDSVFVETECPERIVEKRVPYAVEKKIEVHTGIAWWWLLVAVFVGFVVSVNLVRR